MYEAGTLRFTAPEILLDEDFDERADVFSFGVLLWMLFFAKIPGEPEGGEQEAECEDLDVDLYERHPRDLFSLDIERLREAVEKDLEGRRSRSEEAGGSTEWDDELPNVALSASAIELAAQCCALDPDERPASEEIVDWLEELSLLHFSEDSPLVEGDEGEEDGEETEEEVFDSSADEYSKSDGGRDSFGYSTNSFAGSNPMAGSPTLAQRSSLSQGAGSASPVPDGDGLAGASGNADVAGSSDEAMGSMTNAVTTEITGAAAGSVQGDANGSAKPTLVVPPADAGADGDTEASDSGLDTPMYNTKTSPSPRGKSPSKSGGPGGSKSPGGDSKQQPAPKRRSFFEKKKKARRNMSIVSHSTSDGGRKARQNIEGYLEKKSTVSALMHIGSALMLACA
jgi:hypothetical protein